MTKYSRKRQMYSVTSLLWIGVVCVKRVGDFQNWQSQVRELMLELVPLLKEMGYLAQNLERQEKKIYIYEEKERKTEWRRI
jgi:hypothetical protein